MAVRGPASFVGSATSGVGSAVPGFHSGVLPLPHGLPPGSTVCWDQPLSVYGLGDVTVVVSCRIVAPVTDSVPVVDDDTWDDWGADAVVPTVVEPSTTTLSFSPFVIPMSSLLIPGLGSGASEFKSFVGDWQR
jgi:hypothetical protein